MLRFYPEEMWLDGTAFYALPERRNVGVLSHQRDVKSTQRSAENAYFFTSSIGRVAIISNTHTSDV
jgi:hypothetical protein